MKDFLAGTWKLSPERSRFDAHHRPTAATMVIEVTPEGHYLIKAEGVKENGEKVAERPAELVPDGSEQAVPGLPGLRCISRKPDANTLRVEVLRDDGSVAGGGVYAVSANGKSLEATNFGFDSQLREFRQVTVWDRQ